MAQGSTPATLAPLREDQLDDASRAYIRYHRRRFDVVLAGIEDRIPAAGRGVRILDVGPGWQTALLRERFPEAVVDSIGYAPPWLESREGESHHDFDLNLASEVSRRPDVGAHELIVIGEVIEHLTTSPLAVVSCLVEWLAPGGLLVIQTPNLLALHKRLRMLLGRNPLGSAASVTAGSHNQGHFREYTLGELCEVAAAAGLDVEEARIENYFRHPRLPARLYDRASSALPRSMRQGITLYLRDRRRSR